MPDSYHVHPSSCVDELCEPGSGTKIWHYRHVQKGAGIWAHCFFGQNCNVGNGVVIGSNVKVQNNVSIYTGTVIEDDVFLGPSCVLTNVTNPRSQVNCHSRYEKPVLRRGCTIGANATIGRYAFVGAGAVVVRDVPDYAPVLGVPGKHVGWMSRHWYNLLFDDKGIAVCPEGGFRYKKSNGMVICLDLGEESPLPPELSIGQRRFNDFKHHSCS